MLKNTLDSIVGHLRKHDRTVVDLLQPPLSAVVIRERLSNVGLDSVQGLTDLFTWRNGTKVEEGSILDELHFFPGFYLLSLDDALEMYSSFQSDARWNTAWLPIFANGGGDFYVVTNGDDGNKTGQVVGYMLNESDLCVEFESLETMFRTIDKCYEEGVYFVEDGLLEADDSKAHRIAASFNPDLELYQAIVKDL